MLLKVMDIKATWVYPKFNYPSMKVGNVSETTGSN